MASRKKEPEGIALLSIYGDEDDEMEDADEHQDDVDANGNEPANAENEFKEIGIDGDGTGASDSGNGNTPQQLLNDSSTPKPMSFGGSMTPQKSLFPVSSPQQPPLPQHFFANESDRTRKKGTLTIVDYGHDEVAMSPEAEEGEITTTGRVMYGEELQTANGDLLGKTPPGTVQILTPSTLATPPQSFDQHDLQQVETMDTTLNESESAELKKATSISVEEPKDDDLADKFLPPPPKAKCSDELQEKIIKFLSLKKTTGRSFNAEVRNRKEYRNPDFLLHAMTYQDIDQIGSCFSKDVFDPHGYDKSDYYDEIEVDMRREMERKEQERKKSQKVEFISGATQMATVVPAAKVNMPVPGVSTAGLLPAPAAVDVVPRDGRQNKKSKWDKVDGDRRNPLPTGVQDSVSTVGAHTALLSVASAGSGYTAFAQLRRREAEEKRSSEKKLERRS